MLVLGTKLNRIFIEDPDISSRASYLLLKWQYENEMRVEWEAFRNSFFDKHQPLICFYCGKSNLVREIADLTDSKKRQFLATVDHINPLSNGGSMYDEDNCCVTCYTCNMSKQSKVPGTPEFVSFIQNRIRHNRKQLSEVQTENLLKKVGLWNLRDQMMT
jgi:5-methylcytosine-specific restriction endonuclease McrA